ncbi:MAG: response regulator [Betaproteobacteria bacterium]|nr:response regulator [Betaproteobacteria bacterium]
MSAPTGQVLIVEDEVPIRRFVGDALRREGCIVSEAGTAPQGLDLVALGGIDLVVLDLGLPGMSGLQFIEALRHWSQVPVLILSARGTEQDKIAALDAGADDYLTKPFGLGEFVARVRALRRRPARDEAIMPQCRFGDVEVDLARQRVRRGGADLHLTQLEYRLLACLLSSEGTVMTHRRLLREVWGPGRAEQAHYLRIYVARLRQKLEEDPAQPKYLLTETGVGYRFQSCVSRNDSCPTMPPAAASPRSL